MFSFALIIIVKAYFRTYVIGLLAEFRRTADASQHGAGHIAKGSLYNEEYSVIYAGGLPYYHSRRFVGFVLLG